MLTAALIAASLLLILYLCGVATRQNLRHIVSVLRAEIAHLREVSAAQKATLDILEKSYDDMKRIAGEALKAAHEKHFPKGQGDAYIDGKYVGQMEIGGGIHFDLASVLPDPDLHEVKNCPKCSVSVRSETWPVKCPNEKCQTWFGDILDEDTLT